MLSPAKTKYRKFHKGRIHGSSSANSSLSFGLYGLKALEPARVTAAQIESARRAITRHMKRVGKVWVNIFPDISVSSKPAEVRMGSGKGAPDFWMVRVRPGVVMFEIDGISESIAKVAFELAAAKLPIKTKFIKRLI